MADFLSTPPILTPAFNPCIFTFTGNTDYTYVFEITLGDLSTHTGYLTPYGLTNNYVIDISDYVRSSVDIEQHAYQYEGNNYIFDGIDIEMIKHYEPATSMVMPINFYVYVYTGSTSEAFSDAYIFTGHTFYGQLTNSQFEDWCDGEYLNYTGRTSISMLNKFSNYDYSNSLSIGDSTSPTLVPNARNYISVFNNINYDRRAVQVYLWDKDKTYLGNATISTPEEATPYAPLHILNGAAWLSDSWNYWEWNSGTSKYDAIGDIGDFSRTNSFALYSGGTATVTLGVKVVAGVVNVSLWEDNSGTGGEDVFYCDIHTWTAAPSLSSYTYSVPVAHSAQVYFRYTSEWSGTTAHVIRPTYYSKNYTDEVVYVSGATHSIINFRADYDLIKEILKYDGFTELTGDTYLQAAYATFAYYINSQGYYFKYKILNQDNFRNHLYNLIWVNRMGGIDNVLCEGKNIKSEDIKRKTYQRTPLFFNSDGAVTNRRLTHQDTTYDSTRRIKYQLTTDYMSEEQYEKTEDLFVSHRVWVQDTADGKIYPAIVKSSGFMYKTYFNDGLTAMVVEVEVAYEE